MRARPARRGRRERLRHRRRPPGTRAADRCAAGRAGVVVMPSNAQAARLAGLIAARAGGRDRDGPSPSRPRASSTSASISSRDELARLGVPVVSVDWRPPAGGDPRLGALLARLERSPRGNRRRESARLRHPRQRRAGAARLSPRARGDGARRIASCSTPGRRSRGTAHSPAGARGDPLRDPLRRLGRQRRRGRRAGRARRRAPRARATTGARSGR